MTTIQSTETTTISTPGSGEASARARRSTYRPALRRTRKGFIGIDVGTRYVKIAQVEMTKAGWKLRAAERIDLGRPHSVEHALPPDLGTRIRRTVKTARYHGRDAVCLLPDGFYERESFEFETSSARPVHDIVAEHLTRKQPSEGGSRISDFWTHPLDEPGHSRAEVVSVSTDVIGDLVEKLKPAGLEVYCLDSPPTVAARAVRIARLLNAGRNIASIDWGDKNATYTITSDGNPVFARTLRNAGFRRLIEATASGTGLDEADTETLLERYGAAEAGAGEPRSRILTTLTAHSFDILHDFREELTRTQQYVRRRFLNSTPDTLVMLGGGALLSILRDTVGDALGLEPQIWSADRLADGMPNDFPQCHFANAIALSALAFQESAWF